MGNVILPSGTTVYIDDMKGTINLSELISDIEHEDYTKSFRLQCIDGVAKLGKNGSLAIPVLKKLADKQITEDDKLLAEAALQAIKKIEEGGVTSRRDYSDNRSRSAYNTPSNYSTTKKIEPQKVTFAEIENPEPLHSGLRHYYNCNFCEKMTVGNSFSENLAGANKFFCNFCLRNDYYQAHSNNVMVLTYRGLIGYYYHSYCAIPKTTMSTLEIQELVELHIKVGLENPIFRYDPESFCWFVDFSKVGKTRKRVPVEGVLKTIIQQLACFKIYENVRDASPRKLYEKYKDAVMDFYQKRARQNGEKIFAPTLWGCDIPTKCHSGTRAIPVDVLQSFTPSNLVDYRSSMAKRYG